MPYKYRGSSGSDAGTPKQQHAALRRAERGAAASGKERLDEMIRPSKRMKEFMTYAFAEVDKAKSSAQAEGYRIIDFGVGDPTEPLYDGAVRALQRGASEHSRSGYPSYIGMPRFRQAAAGWLKKRFSVEADPDTQITSTAGSKEAIFHFPFAILDPGESVLMPSIGYPPYRGGTVFAGGIPEYYQLKEENGFLPDLAEIERKISANSGIRMIWINYPNNPTTAMATDAFYKGLIELTQKYGVVIASDEAYTEMYVDKKPRSVLEFSDDWSNIIVFQSLSKRSNATGLRVGFAAGGKDLISYYRKLRTQLDSGVANAVQEAAIAALGDEGHVQEMRALYDEKRKLLTAALDTAGIRYWADSTFYVWAKIHGSSIDFSKRMLTLDSEKKVGINVTPGGMLALGDAPNADGYVRFALVPHVDEVRLAAELMRAKLG